MNASTIPPCAAVLYALKRGNSSVLNLCPFCSASVRLGEHKLSTDIDCDDGGLSCNDTPQNFEAEEVIFHPDYNKPNQFQNDIALIRLNRDAVYSGMATFFFLDNPASILEFEYVRVQGAPSIPGRFMASGLGIEIAFGNCPL